MRSSFDALIVGAGPAGLATSHELSRAGIAHLVVERGGEVGETWVHLYDNLVLHTAKRLSALPGLGFPASTPRFPSRHEFLTYLRRYEQTFHLPVQIGTEVMSLERANGHWVAHTRTGATIETSSVVIATGIVANPYIPEIPGRQAFKGRVFHSVEYRRAEGFKGFRALVVGAGNSAGEISVELALAGANVTLAVRSGARVVPREIIGIPIQYFSVPVAALPNSLQSVIVTLMARGAALVRGSTLLPPPASGKCPNVPLIGFHLVDLLRAERIRLKAGIAGFTPSAVRFSDGSEEPFDVVILATGYRAAVGMLDGLIRLDRCGFGSRRDHVVSLDQPDLYFVGHNYDIRGALLNIGRDARLAAGRIKSALRDGLRSM